jgi:hypothetical protein
MFNRVKELLTREGLLARQASEEEVRAAIGHWVEMVEEANKETMVSH